MALKGEANVLDGHFQHTMHPLRHVATGASAKP